ncbi:L-serine dehydratase, iron-sulfur-dependent subunit alpha [Anoxybacter fermentans]|uniref:L-serine dehydratase n=1 Tax=Anoxybacter fermentans TaxID=1323375 RepID=A0A3Q9HPG3_9FIRM|nr:L-serine ammonia-lyase, iron-sulfur-dependent, subunit alpha [Anoxybacter fermentans]AZR72716.1 L-serine dehydratase, iron-sulfur-dependent subunit alpha [Anoxybacter fermentans]
MLKLYSIEELVKKAEETNRPISDLVVEYEMNTSDLAREEIFNRMAANLQVMKEAIEKGMQQTVPTKSGMISDEARRMAAVVQEGKTLAGGIVPLALAKALAVATVNATMGKIVAGPTAGSCGIIPGALLAVAEVKKLDDEKIIRGLLTAAGLGTVVARKATLAGAAGGCQAECGVASAMAAGGIVEMMEGTPAQVSAAFALALKNMLGLVCDPVAGLVEVPCVKRNAMAASHAIAAAELALAGIKSVIPADEVVEAMGEIGDALPKSLKETARGGLAVTATGKRIAEEFLGDGIK